MGLNDLLIKPKKGFFTKIKDFFSGTPITDDIYEELEDLLLQSDVGLSMTTNLINQLEKEVKSNKIDNTEEVYEILQEMADGIIEESLIICEELFAEARQARTQKVRDKYFRAMNNLEYLRVAFIVATSNYANSLINNGIDIDHTLLTIRLGAAQTYKKELNKIWKEYAKSMHNWHLTLVHSLYGTSVLPSL